MNEIVNKFLLAADKFMPEMYLKQSGFTYIACGPFTKNKKKKKKEYNNLKKQEIQDIFTRMNLIKLAFNMIRLTKILNIWQEEQSQMKF